MTSSPSTYNIPNLESHPDLMPVLQGQNLIVKRAPIFSTGIAEMSSGRERRRQRWSYPKWEIRVSYEVIRERPSKLELSQMYAFFCGRAGSYRSFFFYDPYLLPAVAVPIGTGDGINKNFQLLRVYDVGGLSYSEPVRGVLGTFTVYVDGAPVSATLGAYGMVTLATAPATGKVVTWSGTPLTLVRFADDTIEPAQMTANLWSLTGVTLRTFKR